MSFSEAEVTFSDTVGRKKILYLFLQKTGEGEKREELSREANNESCDGGT